MKVFKFVTHRKVESQDFMKTLKKIEDRLGQAEMARDKAREEHEK